MELTYKGKVFFKYAFGRQFAIFFRALQEFAIRSLLLPEKLAIWNLITIIANTFTLFQANIVAASNRLLSQLHGAKASPERLFATRGNSIYLEFFQQTLLSFAILLIAPFLWVAPEELGALLYFCAAAIMVSNGLLALLIGLHESSGIFARLGVILPLNALVQAGAVYWGTLEFGLSGLIGGAILGLCLNILFMFGSFHLAGMRWRARPDTTIGKKLGRTAVSFRLADLPTSIFYLLDTILASFWLKPAELALYMTARFLVNFSTQVVFAINRVGLARLGNKIGNKSSIDEIAQFLSSQFVLVYLFLLLASVAVFEPAFRWGVPTFLPAYSETLFALPFLMLTTLTSGASLFIRNYWIQKKQWKNIGLSGGGALIGALIVFGIGQFWFEEIGARELAILSFLGQLPYALGLITAISFSVGGMKHFVYRLITFLLSFASIVICLQYNGAFIGAELLSIVDCVMMIGLGIVLCSPFIFTGGWMYKKIQSLE